MKHGVGVPTLLEARTAACASVEACLGTWVRGSALEYQLSAEQAHEAGCRVLTLGSCALGVPGVGADIDCVAIVPYFIERHDFFAPNGFVYEIYFHGYSVEGNVAVLETDSVTGFPVADATTFSVAVTTPATNVIGAGLSATDCIVEALQAGWTVFHSFRGPAASAKIVTKFGGDHWIRSGMYPEYNALAAKITGDFDGTNMFDKMRRFRFSEMATSYTPHADTELREIGRDGSFTLRRGTGAFAAEVSGHASRVAETSARDKHPALGMDMSRFVA